MRGSTLAIPDGALRISMGEDRSLKAEITEFRAAIQVWTSWLVIAFARLEDTRAARGRLQEATANSDDTAESLALDEEFQGSLQTISAAVFALDAFYGVIRSMITLDEAERDARKQNNTTRPAWIADAVIRGSRVPNKAAKAVAKNIHLIYKLRDGAVHPRFVAEEFGIHPGLNQRVPKYYIDYALESSEGVVAAAVEAIMWVTDRPKLRNAAISGYAPAASALLHEIVDKFLSYKAEGPFTTRADQ